MPQPARYKPVIHVAPFNGLNERVADKLLGLNILTQADDVVLRSGMVSPRPGIALIQSDPFSLAPIPMGNAGFTAAGGVAAGSTWVFWSYRINDQIWRIKRNGESATLVTGSITNPGAMFYDEAGDILYVYEASSNKLRKVSAASTGSPSVSDIATLGTALSGLTVDLVNGFIYYTSLSGLHRISTAGAGNTLLVADANTGVTYRGVAVDPTGGKVAWTSQMSLTHVVWKANLDGTGSQSLVLLGGPSDTDTAFPNGLSFDAVSGDLYIARNAGLCKVPMSGAGLGVDDVTDVVAGGLLPLWISYNDDAVFVINSIGGTPEMYRMSRIDIEGPELVSVAPIQRSLLEDLEIFQLRDGDNQETSYGLRKVTSQTLERIPLGYTPGSPNYWCSNSRTADNAGVFSTKSSRASFAWQGAGLNTGRGGFLIADGANQLTCNYVLGDTIQRLTFSSAGNVTLTLNGEAVLTITDTSSADNMRIAFFDSAQFDHVNVSKSGAGSYPGDPYIFEFRFCGVWAGKNLPLLGVTAGTGAASIASVQEGGTDTDANLYLRPCGLPRPAKPTSATTGTGKTGYYSWAVTFVSPTWGIESPPSPVSAFRQLTNQNANISIAIPSTLYFDSDQRSGGVVPQGPLVSSVRLWRRRWGATGADGTGASGNWYFVKESAILPSDYGTTKVVLDDVADAALTDDLIPSENGYPPANANFVVNHGGFAVWAAASGDRRLWIGEPAKQGQLNVGQLGFEYVRDDSFEDVEASDASDVPFTGLYSDGNIILIATPDRTIAGGITPYLDPTPNSFPVLEGIPPPASHWVIVESRVSGGAVSAIYWMTIDGHVYRYSGNFTATLVSLPLEATPDALVRKYWNDIDTYGDLDSWMWASAVIDQKNFRVMFSAIKKSGLARQMIVYDLLSENQISGWTLWNIPSTVLWDTRDSNDETIIALAANGSKVYRLNDGGDDAGTSFTWVYAFGAIAPSLDPWQEVKVKDVALDFAERSFGGAAAAVNVAVYKDIEATPTILGSDLSVNSGKGGVRFKQVNERGLRFRFAVSGTQTDLKTHPELTAIKVKYEPVGRANR